MPSFFPWSSSSSSHNRRPSNSRAGSTYRSHSRDSYGNSRSGSSSYYKRRPRDGFIQRLIYRLKHLLRELWYYARRNPVKLFFLVIMPLISGGVLAGIAKQFGIRLPGFLMGKSQGRGYGGYYGSQGYGPERRGGGLGGLASMAGGLSGGNVGSLMSIAKMFI